LTPPIEKPGTRENRARVRSLSLPGFSRLSQARLSFPFSLSLYRLHYPVFFSFFILRVFYPAPPRTALFLSRFYLGFSSPTRRQRRRRRRCARSRSSLSFSTFTLPSLLFCSPPAAFLPLLRFRRSSRRAPIIPVCASSETISSSSLLLPHASVLPLATLTACVTRRGIRRPGRNSAPGERPCEAKEEEEERDGSLKLRDGASSDIRFYKERAGILEGSRDGRTAVEMEGTGPGSALPTSGVG